MNNHNQHDLPDHFTHCTILKPDETSRQQYEVVIEPLPPILPLPKTELFVVTNDFPHIIYEKGSYYLIHPQDDNESYSDSLLVLNERNKVYRIDLTEPRVKSQHPYLKLSIHKEIEAIKEGRRPGVTQINAGRFLLKNFAAPPPLYQAVIKGTGEAARKIRFSSPTNYFFANTATLDKQFLIGRYPTEYFQQIRILNFTRPASLAQLKTHTLNTPVYKLDTSLKPDNKRIKNLIHSYEELLELDEFKSVLFYQDQKTLSLSPEEKAELQKIIDTSGKASPDDFPRRPWPAANRQFRGKIPAY